LQIDLDRRHYGSLSDGELFALDRDELTEAARKCYDDEMARRGLNEPEQADEVSDEREHGIDHSAEADGDWLADAAVACSYTSVPGGTAASDAEHALAVLQEAGIPCQISVIENDPDDSHGPAFPEFRVMVPGALNLQATSVLDKEIFNAELEASWRTHFEALTDDQLVALHPDVICAGFVDRIARLKKAYNDEIARRFNRSSA